MINKPYSEYTLHLADGFKTDVDRNFWRDEFLEEFPGLNIDLGRGELKVTGPDQEARVDLLEFTREWVGGYIDRMHQAFGMQVADETDRRFNVLRLTEDHVRVLVGPVNWYCLMALGDNTGMTKAQWQACDRAVWEGGVLEWRLVGVGPEWYSHNDLWERRYTFYNPAYRLHNALSHAFPARRFASMQ
jgi:hypothetical protein